MKINWIASISALMLGLSAPVYAGTCENISLEECKGCIQEVDRAIAWLQDKQSEDAVATEAAMQQCKATTDPGADVSVLLNCMLDILGP